MEPSYTAADLEYVRANFLSLEELCASRGESVDRTRALIAAEQLPGPSYVLDDGTEMVPRDYFRLVDEAGGEAALHQVFARRFLEAGGTEDDLVSEWEGYLSGDYGVCLKQLTPENIVRKSRLVTEIDALLGNPRPDDAAWRDRLRRSVDELDDLERQFAPQYDRARWGPSSRDRCVTMAHERFPDVFVSAHDAPR